MSIVLPFIFLHIFFPATEEEKDAIVGWQTFAWICSIPVFFLIFIFLLHYLVKKNKKYGIWTYVILYMIVVLFFIIYAYCVNWYII
jgi:hypothetical protein